MTHKHNVPDEKMPLALHLSLLAKQYYGAYTRMMEGHELERYFVVLLILDAAKTKLTQQDLCDELQMDKVSMVRVLDYLSAKGFIERTINPDDRRARWICLTPKAHAALPDIKKKTANLQKRVFEGMAENQRKIFFDTLHMIQTNLETIPSDHVILKFKKTKK